MADRISDLRPDLPLTTLLGVLAPSGTAGLAMAGRALVAVGACLLALLAFVRPRHPTVVGGQSARRRPGPLSA